MKEEQKTKLKTIDLSNLLKPYENKWVALSSDYKKILESGKSLEEIIKKCKKRKYKRPIYFKVLPFDKAFVPFNS